MPSSKIPVGKHKIEPDRSSSIPNGDKLSDEMDINRSSRSPSPALVSKIPVGGWRNKTTAYRNLMERQEKDNAVKGSHNRQQGGRRNLDFEYYGHWDIHESKGNKVPSITLNDGETFRLQSEFNNHSHKTKTSDSKIPYKLTRQRSRSAGPSRTMRLSPIGQI